MTRDSVHSRRVPSDRVPEFAETVHRQFPQAAGESRVLAVFGTRPEAIKLAPVLHSLRLRSSIQTIVVGTGQHTDLLYPFLEQFGIKLDFDLQVMRPDQAPSEVCFYHGIPVAHVEAGLRSGNVYSPFPEEMNRQLISRIATYHFAATELNRQTLLAEGVPDDHIFVTGNPVVDSLHSMLARTQPSPALRQVLSATSGQRLIVLTTHRRESFGDTMRQHLRALRHFVESHLDLSLVHPNPNVGAAARAELEGGPRIHLIAPLDYSDFIQLMQHAWLLVSDSGGIQEEAPTLKKPLLVLRENTERQEVVDAGVAILVGNTPGRLSALLEKTYADPAWEERVKAATNPFGDGSAGSKISDVIQRELRGVAVGHNGSAR
jgi:UDP-N-acetylglucosamine 2-epimerase (non-hydrolysing)